MPPLVLQCATNALRLVRVDSAAALAKQEVSFHEVE